MLASAGMVRSMSRKGDCHDNAPVESFFGSLKADLLSVFKWCVFHIYTYATHKTERHIME